MACAPQNRAHDRAGEAAARSRPNSQLDSLLYTLAGKSFGRAALLMEQMSDYWGPPIATVTVLHVTKVHQKDTPV